LDTPRLETAAFPPKRPRPYHPAARLFIARYTMRSVCSIMVATFMFVVFTPRPASAILDFYKVYKAEYLDNHKDKKYVAEVDKGTNKCFVCHQGRKSKKNHNLFGKPLVEMLDKIKDKKDAKKIKESLAKVVAMPVDPKDKKSETYLDRINASKWPGGELKQLMEEPKEEKKDEKKDEKK
jgi:hypothetical protein